MDRVVLTVAVGRSGAVLVAFRYLLYKTLSLRLSQRRWFPCIIILAIALYLGSESRLSSTRCLPILSRRVLYPVARPLDSTELDPLCEIQGHTTTSAPRHCLRERVGFHPESASRLVPSTRSGTGPVAAVRRRCVCISVPRAAAFDLCLHLFLSSHRRGVTFQGNARQAEIAQGAHGCC